MKVGEAKLAFKSKAVCVAVETGLLASLVLLTFPKPTFEALIPLAIFASVIALLATTGAAAVPVKSPANCNFPFVVASASTIVAPAIAVSTYVFTAFWVGNKTSLVPKLVIVDLLTAFSFNPKPGTVGAAAVPAKSPAN